MEIAIEMVGTSPIIALLLMSYHLVLGVTSEIDNGVLGSPEVVCGRDFVHFKVVTKKPFGGRVYVKGEFANSKCVERAKDGTGEDEIGTERHEQMGKRPAEYSRPKKEEEKERDGKTLADGFLKQNRRRTDGAVPEGEEEEDGTTASETEGTARDKAMMAEEEAEEETLRQFLLELQMRHNNNTKGSQRTIPSHLPGFGSADQLKRWRSFLRGKPGLDGQSFRRYGSRLSPDANGECPLVCPPCEEKEGTVKKGLNADGGKRQRRLAKEHSAELKVPLGECNARRDRMANPPGMQVSFTVVVSFHPNFITRVDRAYNIQCAYQEPERLLSTQIDVSSPPIIQISNQMETPHCEYRIHGQSSGDQQVRNVRVGDIVEHEWVCNGREADDARGDAAMGQKMAQMFGLLVHDCFVDDGKSRREKVVDSKGCSKDPLILPTPLYSSDSLRAHIISPVAKFPDGDLVGFQCSITVCMRDLGKCDGFTPPNCSDNTSFDSNFDQIHSTQNRTKRSPNDKGGQVKAPSMDWELNSPVMTVFDLAERPEEATEDGFPTQQVTVRRQPLAHSLRSALSSVHPVPQMCVSLPLFALFVSVSTFLVTVSAGTFFVALLFRNSLPGEAKH